MGERELRAKYGGKLAKAINRAIRAEVTGGNAALDKLTQLAGPALHSGWYEKNGQPTEQAAEYFKHKHEVVDRMESMVRDRWDVPVTVRERAGRERKTKLPKRGPKSAARKAPRKGQTGSPSAGRRSARKGPPGKSSGVRGKP